MNRSPSKGEPVWLIARESLMMISINVERGMHHSFSRVMSSMVAKADLYGQSGPVMTTDRF